MENLTELFWSEHFERKNINTKLKQKIFDWLNGDNFGGFVLDKKVFWIEKVCSTSKLPNYIYNYLIKWAEKRGFTYLYKQ